MLLKASKFNEREDSKNIVSLVGLAHFKVKVRFVERTSDLGSKNFLMQHLELQNKFSTIT